jgi:hypothetical protein
MLSLDWLSASIPHSSLESVVDLLNEINGQDYESRNFGQYRYDRSFIWDGGAYAVHFDSTPERSQKVHNGRALIVITGRGWHQIDPETTFQAVKALVNDMWAKGTRIDCAFDDYQMRKKPCEVWADSCQEERHYTRFRKASHTQEYNSKGEVTGDMVTWGTRGQNGSGSYLRYYRKDLESDGEIQAYRWEVEFSKQKAQEALFQLSQCPDLQSFSALLGALVGGSIDFVRRKDKNLDRATRLEWWAEIVSEIGVSSISGVQNPPDVQKSREWIRKSVTSSLKLLQEAYGKDDFWNWLEAMVSTRTLTKAQRASLRHYQNEMCDRDRKDPRTCAGAFRNRSHIFT